MIATLAAVLGSFAFMIHRSYKRARESGGYEPRGKRWTNETLP